MFSASTWLGLLLLTTRHQDTVSAKRLEKKFCVLVGASAILATRKKMTMIKTPLHIRSTVNADGAVILDVKNGAMLGLNSMGGFIWERLQKGTPIEEIAKEIVQETSADAGQVERDLDEFLEQLKAKKLVTISA